MNSIRSGILVRRKLLNAAVSSAALVAQGVFAALFPSDCRLCGAPLGNISRLPVCPDCLGAIHALSGETCSLCGEWLSNQAGSEPRICSACNQDGGRPFFSKAVAYGAYDRELRELIHLLKYEQVLPATNVLGSMLAAAIRKLDLAGSFLVVPVPLHRSKQRQRRFNQAEIIARSAMKQLPELNCKLAAGLLVRHRPTASQIGLTRPQRAQNIRGAFRVPHLNQVAGRAILLVDDVLTTGTTASECARILRKAGAKDVWVATVARTFKNSAMDWTFLPEPQEQFAAPA